MNIITQNISRLQAQIGVFALLILASACAVKPSSDMDSPEYHHKAGMRHIEMESIKSLSLHLSEQSLWIRSLLLLMLVWV